MKSSAMKRNVVFAASLWAACLVGFAWMPAPAHAASAASMGRRVVRADEIGQAGVTRLFDVLRLFDAWAPATLDGFSWQTSPRGLDPHQTASWLVMVDGVRIDIGQFGVTAVNRIPVHVGDIDSVEVFDVPRLSHGEFTGAGLIHIHTRRAAPGYDAGAAASTGNEAGDPGPWAYTPAATPNVDRIGPRYTVRGSYGIEAASIAASYLWDRHYATDEAVRERTFAIAAGEYPQMRLAGGSGRVAARFLGGPHRLSLWSSRFEDFFFFKPYGREIPVVSRLVVASLSGQVPLGESVELDYRFSRTARAIGYRTNSMALDFDWQTTTWLGGVDVSAHTASLRHRYSAGYERVEAACAYSLTRADYHLARFGAAWEWSSRDDLSFRAGAMATEGEGGLTAEGTAGAAWQVSGSHRLEAAASYVERRPERDDRIWFWQGRGYGFLRDAGVDVQSEGPLGTARRRTMDVEWTVEPRRAVSGSVSGYYRGFSELLLEEQIFDFDPAEAAFGGPIRLVPGRKGSVAGAGLNVEVRPSPRIRYRAAYRFERAVSGDALFRRVWDAVPHHILTQSLVFTPTPSLSLRACFSWMSATEWHDYERAEVQTVGVYRSTLDDVLTLDLALAKWFWGERLKGSLLVRNLLFSAPRYHPIGASFDTTVFAGIEFGVGGVR